MKEDIKDSILEKLGALDIMKLYNNIDGIAMNIENGRLEMLISSNFTGPYVKMWKNNRGGVLYYDIKEYLKSGKFPEYFILTEDDGSRFLIRLLKEDEEEHFRLRKLIHGKLKDANYMILRDFSEVPQKNHEYIEQVALEISEDDEEEFNDDIDIPLEDEASLDHNVSLFED